MLTISNALYKIKIYINRKYFLIDIQRGMKMIDKNLFTGMIIDIKDIKETLDRSLDDGIQPVRDYYSIVYGNVLVMEIVIESFNHLQNINDLERIYCYLRFVEATNNLLNKDIKDDSIHQMLIQTNKVLNENIQDLVNIIEKTED